MLSILRKLSSSRASQSLRLYKNWLTRSWKRSRQARRRRRTRVLEAKALRSLIKNETLRKQENGRLTRQERKVMKRRGKRKTPLEMTSLQRQHQVSRLSMQRLRKYPACPKGPIWPARSRCTRPRRTKRTESEQQSKGSMRGCPKLELCDKVCRLTIKVLMRVLSMQLWKSMTFLVSFLFIIAHFSNLQMLTIL